MQNDEEADEDAQSEEEYDGGGGILEGRYHNDPEREQELQDLLNRKT
jgi:hypothetical protein